MYTEDEAKTKECCGAPAIVRALMAQVLANAGTDPKTLPPELQEQLKNSNCIASQCMAWRWEYWSSGTTADERNKTFGYCGLAGER